ncbi:hypothetical protein [Saccharicrinis sp. FJH54]|uniref:hypothetical protein n=1 Tax=Saccharicrinis sp. FJH54 TaxID=3344665 RepID=UPI0035D4FEB4
MEFRRERLRQISVVILAVFYLSGSGLLPGSGNLLPFQSSSNNQNHIRYCSLVASPPCIGVTEPEISVSESACCQLIDFKHAFNSPDGIIKVNGFLIGTTYFQYTKIAENFLVLFRKADMLFPFQYFW